MVTSWRRAFCTTTPRDHKDPTINVSDHTNSNKLHCTSPSAKRSRPGFSNPTTPRLQTRQLPISSPSLWCKTIAGGANVEPAESPNLHSKTTPRSTKSPKSALLGSSPASPRSPLKLSLFRNSFKFRSSCGICLNSVKTSQRTAIYTAECGHAFHFPCISSHVRKHNNLICPVCNATWKDVPLLSIQKNLQNDAVEPNNDNVQDKNVLIVESSSPRRMKHEPLYDDDEPLLPSTPEINYDVVDEQFQCFSINTVNSRTVQVRLLPESAVISSSRCYETYAVSLRVKAPPRSNTQAFYHRLPVDLVAVLDLSVSMSGPKLQMLKRAMRILISSLGSGDRLSLVAFSTAPVRLLPLIKMTASGQRAAQRMVDRLACGQGTSLVDALEKASKVLEDRREKNYVTSVILLSDGQDGVIKHSTPRFRSSQGSSYAQFTRIEIPIHSSGFGRILTYNSTDLAEDGFSRWVGGLFNVVVQDLRIQVNTEAPTEILAVYSCHGRPTLLSSSSVRLGNLYVDEERELLAELRVPSSPVKSNHLLSVRCLYKDPTSQEVVYGRDQGLLVPPRTPEVRSMDPRIERLRCVFITTRAIAEARRLVECKNDFMTAHHLLASSRALLVQSGSGINVEYVKGLEAELAEIEWMRQHQDIELRNYTTMQRHGGSIRERVPVMDENGESVTPSSARRAAEKLTKAAITKKSLDRVRDLHGFENARF